MPPDVGVVLYAHGTVEDLDDLPRFVQRIRRGRPPPPGLVEELRHRYEVIGGSPLLEATRAQAAALEAALGRPTWVAMRLWEPGLGAVLPRALAAGVRRLVVLPLAPFSTRVYAEAAEAEAAAVRASGVEAPSLLHCAPWGETPALVAAEAALIRGAGLRDDDALVLTAHSLPLRAIAGGDTYAVEVERTAAAVSAALGRPATLAYQSEGADGGEWLGPGLRRTLEELAAAGTRRVVVAPVGFLAEHVETLYDLDVEARRQAEALGLTFVRVPALGVHPGLVAALVEVVERALAAPGGAHG